MRNDPRVAAARKRSGDSPTKWSSSANAPSAVRGSHGKTLDVLLIEDDAGIRSLIVALLGNLAPGRYRVTSVDGNAALRLLRRRDPDVIVMDLLLPGLNGFELLRHLKAEKEYLLRRTIVVTAASDQTLAGFSQSWPVRHLLRKPFDVFELASLILVCATEQPSA